MLHRHSYHKNNGDGIPIRCIITVDGNNKTVEFKDYDEDTITTHYPVVFGVIRGKQRILHINDDTKKHFTFYKSIDTVAYKLDKSYYTKYMIYRSKYTLLRQKLS